MRIYLLFYLCFEFSSGEHAFSELAGTAGVLSDMATVCLQTADDKWKKSRLKTAPGQQ